MNINLDVAQGTGKKLKKILAFHSDNEQFAQSLIEYEISELKKGLTNIEFDLKSYEERYNISSDEFYRKFESGEAGDDEETMIWAGLYEMYLQNKKRLKELE